MRTFAATCGAFAILMGVLCAPTLCAADEVVAFASARYLVGSLQQRLARERGVPVVRAPAEMIKGYLSKPNGHGPFPAVVHLHGCGGLTAQRRAHDAAQFTAWGYVILEVDSFATRGIKDACAAQALPARQADAMGALSYVAKLPFVDAKRIAVIGYSQGGSTALEIASLQPVDIFDVSPEPKFKAAVAYYPWCSAAGDRLAIPTLILIGGLDDWTPAASCDRLLQRFDTSSASLKITVFPDAYHSFDNTTASIYGVRYYGHWLRYNPDASARAAAEARDFLAAQLGH